MILYTFVIFLASLAIIYATALFYRLTKGKNEYIKHLNISPIFKASKIIMYISAVLFISSIAFISLILFLSSKVN